ncbi:TIGR01777 family oxidoreductase [Ornithinimicrobium sp. LYQ103]|uniref:TIGR01777 family oxidoreductase n=1 Tax=Ornithinimicrobium sp. LYQ103 TaxID=3378796 RepID=UPI003851A095
MTEPVPSSTGRTVAINGASGLIGSALSAALRGRGDQVVHLVRRAPRASGGLEPGVREVQWSPGGELDPAALDGVSAVVNLAGAGIGDQRWSDARKRLLVSSRLESTGTIARAVAACAPDTRPRLLSSSAVGYYGDRGEDVLTEESDPGDGFLANLCRDWEAATWPAERAGASVVHFRTGIVISPRGGALGRLMLLARFGLAGPLGRGKQYWSWITLHDHARALTFLVDHPSLTGAVNLTGPHPDTQADVVRALGDELHRPTLLPAPGFALRLGLGELAQDMVLASQRVLPQVLSEAGFSWDHEDLSTAMTWLGHAQREAAPADRD